MTGAKTSIPVLCLTLGVTAAYVASITGGGPGEALILLGGLPFLASSLPRKTPQRLIAAAISLALGALAITNVLPFYLQALGLAYSSLYAESFIQAASYWTYTASLYGFLGLGDPALLAPAVAALLYRLYNAREGEALLVFLGIVMVSAILGAREAWTVMLLPYILYVEEVGIASRENPWRDRGLMVSGLIMQLLAFFPMVFNLPLDTAWMLSAAACYTVSAGALAPRVRSVSG